MHITPKHLGACRLIVWVQSWRAPLLLGLLLWVMDAVLSSPLDRFTAAFWDPAGLHGAAVPAGGAVLPVSWDWLHVEGLVRRKRSGSGEQSSIVLFLGIKSTYLHALTRYDAPQCWCCLRCLNDLWPACPVNHPSHSMYILRRYMMLVCVVALLAVGTSIEPNGSRRCMYRALSRQSCWCTITFACNTCSACSVKCWWI